MPTLTKEDLLVELTNLTGMSAQDWEDFLSLPPEAQNVVAHTYRSCDWAQSPDTIGAIISAFETAGSIAGAASAIIAFTALL